MAAHNVVSQRHQRVGRSLVATQAWNIAGRHLHRLRNTGGEPWCGLDLADGFIVEAGVAIDRVPVDLFDLTNRCAVVRIKVRGGRTGEFTGIAASVRGKTACQTAWRRNRQLSS